MADVDVNYTFKIPDEPFVDDFSGNKTMTFNYKGPEVLKVTLPVDRPGVSSPYTQQLDGPVYDGESVVEINVTDNPELLPIADLLYGRPYNVEATFDEETLSDGTIYHIQNNCSIHDYYWPPKCNLKDDDTFDSWILESDGTPKLELFLRDPLSPKMRTYIAKADMFVEILDQYTLADAEATLLADYKTALTNYRAKVATPWKFPGQNPFDLEAPKIPMDLVTRHNEIKTTGLGNMLGEDPNKTPVE